MAYCKIVPIKAGVHLSNIIDYITDDKKTDYKRLTDTYNCTLKYAEAEFALTRDDEVIRKGNNLAWHITQSFSPEDKISYEQALETGKEFMRRMYPGYQYIIATHTDKEHIHNHILVNSVNSENHQKLHSNKKSLALMQKINDDLAEENGLSVIESDSQNHKKRLGENLEKALSISKSMSEFLTAMQQYGYQIKVGKELSFKDDKMQKYMRSKSVSYEYTQDMIKYRLAQNSKNNISEKPDTGNLQPGKKRELWDDKIKYRNKRKKFMTEIDASIKKSNTFEEFISDMARKNFSVKRGRHTAFKNDDFMERYFRLDSLKDPMYTEAGIRYRIEYKDLYGTIINQKIDRVVTTEGKYGGLDSWAHGVNAQRKIDSTNWITANLTDGKNFGQEINYYIFLRYYDGICNNIKDTKTEIEQIECDVDELLKAKKIIEKYFTLKTAVEHNKNKNYADEGEAAKDKSVYMQYCSAAKELENIKSKYGSLSLRELSLKISEMKQRKKNFEDNYIHNHLILENLENIKYNFEASYIKGGYNVTREDAERAYNNYNAELLKTQERRERQENRKQTIKDFVGDLLGM